MFYLRNLNIENRMSLNEIGKIFGLSRSGIYHRLKKICDIAEKL